MRLAVLVAALAAVLAGCAGVPASSAPEVVQTIGGAQQVQPAAVTPEPGADPREIVAGFLTNNAANDEHHSAARAFLTPEEKNRWSDVSQTTVLDNPQIGTYENGTVTVQGHIVGTLDQNGVYTPNLQGSGNGVGVNESPIAIGLKQVNGQWRIDQVPNGLVISASQFAQYYTQRVIYFYDQSEQHLLPVPRYSALADPVALASWLMTQLVTQPLSTALPSIPNPAQIKVNLGTVLTVDIPGASQLDDSTRNRMAAQVALTLEQAARGSDMEITDGTKPVQIPSAGGPRFTAGQFAGLLSPVSGTPTLYYINKGAVYDQTHKPLPGKLGDGSYALTSVALAAMSTSSPLLVAATAGPPDDARLLLGQLGGTLRTTGVRGKLSRPAWVPGSAEVWVGAGAQLYRVDPDGKATVVPMAASSGTATGRILAIRFSPEASRVAVVIAAPGGTSQIWIGTVVRAADSVRVTGLYAISPLGIAVTDVAWNDQLRLFAIGKDVGSGAPNVYEVECDGSGWRARGIGNIPAPDSITAAEGQVAAVSAGGAIFVQPASGWQNPPGGPMYGTNPVYLE
jgi:hypothetical protein